MHNGLNYLLLDIMKIIKTTLDSIEKFRAGYLNALPEFQELFIELMIPHSDCYVFLADNKQVGYAVKTMDGVLIEFYIVDNYLSQSHAIFKEVLQCLSINQVFCKSFDALLLSNCLLSALPYSILGRLYRHYVGASIKMAPDIIMKKTGASSVERLLLQDESIKELFETKQQLIGFIENEHVFEFYKNNELIGCGMVIRTHPAWDYCDLGLWVTPLKRGNDYGAQIILNLRAFALKNNMKPSCGCAIDNVASQKTIEKSGFVSTYNMINFKV